MMCFHKGKLVVLCYALVMWTVYISDIFAQVSSSVHTEFVYVQKYVI